MMLSVPVLVRYLNSAGWKVSKLSQRRALVFERLLIHYGANLCGNR
jgi:hypothetical protein